MDVSHFSNRDCPADQNTSILLHCGHFIFYFLVMAGVMWGLVPQLETEPVPPALVVQSLSHWTTREFPTVSILNDVLAIDIY